MRTILILAVIGFTGTAMGQSIFDDFNDGNDSGWTRISPLAGFAAPGAFSFPGGNTYQIHAPVSPNFAALGPGRAAAFRMDLTYTNFYQTVDIVNWDTTKNSMVMGMLARAKDIGAGTGTPGTTDAYLAVFNDTGVFYLIRTLNEVPTILAEIPIAEYSDTKDYRILFTGFGDLLTAQMYDLSDMSLDANLSLNDATYTSGVSGVFVFDGTSTGNTTATATFDNYSAVPEPGAAGLLGVAGWVFGMRRRRATR